MDIVTIDGSVALTVARAAKALDCGRSTIYRRIDSGELEVVRFDGRPKITARSILKLLGLAEPISAPSPPEPRRRGRPRLHKSSVELTPAA